MRDLLLSPEEQSRIWNEGVADENVRGAMNRLCLAQAEKTLRELEPEIKDVQIKLDTLINRLESETK